ncbi:hypothetical protein BH18ACT11_BH18ACT11_14290 [soil metagenome]
MEPLRVLVADDHPLFREGIKTMLASAEGVELVGEASTGEEAVGKTVELLPDVIVMDVKMPGGGVIQATRKVLQQSPHVRVLIVTMFEDHVSNILSKLQVADRTQAVIRAREAGLGRDNL